MKTINLKGNEYAPVDERLRAFHKSNPNCSIRTETQLKGEKIIEAHATVIPDVTNPERYFHGSSLGIIGQEKAFEKLETVAVGRALAFAGYLADGIIASKEEMDRFQANTEESDNTFILKQLLKNIKKINDKGGYKNEQGQVIDIQKQILESTGESALYNVDYAILNKALIKTNQILQDLN